MRVCRQIQMNRHLHILLAKPRACQGHSGTVEELPGGFREAIVKKGLSLTVSAGIGISWTEISRCEQRRQDAT